MSRGLATTTNAAMDDEYIIPVLFAHFAFDTAPLYLHTDLGTITTLSNNWLGVGDLGSIGSVQEGLDISPYALTLSLALIAETSGSIFEEALTEDYYQRLFTLYVALRNSTTGALLDDPFELFHGKIDQLTLVHGRESSYVQCIVESELADFNRAPLQYYSDTTLQAEYSGDLGFEYLDTMANWVVSWGSKRIIRIGQAYYGGQPTSYDYGGSSASFTGEPEGVELGFGIGV